jgi:hypothetical protein
MRNQTDRNIEKLIAYEKANLGSKHNTNVSNLSAMTAFGLTYDTTKNLGVSVLAAVFGKVITYVYYARKIDSELAEDLESAKETNNELRASLGLLPKLE